MATAYAAEDLKPKLSEQDVQEIKAATSLVLFGENKDVEDADKASAAKAAKAADEAKAKTEKEEKDKKAKADAAAADKKPEGDAATKVIKMPTAAEIADSVAERMKPPVVPEIKAAPVELSKEDRRNREVLEFMAKDEPDFERLLERFDAFIPAEKAYRQKWEKENPGETYDAGAADHEEFYKAHDPIQTEPDQEAFDRARNRFEARQEADKTYTEREVRRQYNEAVKEVTAKLANHETVMTKELLKETDPELAKINLKELKKEDPLAAIAIKPYIGTLIAMTAEIEKAFTENLHYQITQGKNPLHDAIQQSIFEFEKELLTLPPEGQLFDGKPLAPIAEYNKMSKEDRAKHWTIWLEPKAIRALMVRNFANKVREDYDEMRAVAGKPPRVSAENEAQKKTEEKPKEVPKAKGNAKFPNLSGGAGDGTSGPGAPAAGTSDAKLFTSTLFGS